MSKGTIFYIGGFEMPDRNAAAHRVLNNAKIFRNLGYDVVFLGVTKSLGVNDVMKSRESVQGFDSWCIPYPVSNLQWIRYLSNIDSFLRVISLYTDVRAVICYNYQAFAMIKIRSYCWRNKIRLLADCTEWYSTKGANIIFKVIKGLDSMMRMRIIHKQLDGIIVISRYLENYYSSCRKVICIPPLVDPSEDKWISDLTSIQNFWKLTATQNTKQLQDGRIRLVYAGSPGKQKDKLNFVMDLLYSFPKRCKFILYIIGITKEQFLLYNGNQKEMLDQMKEQIFFLGRLTHRESIDYIKSADFSMFIRDDSRMTRAGFPTKFVESVSCGTPVITTRTSDLEEYVKEGVNGFFIDMKDKTNAVEVLRKVSGMSDDDIKSIKKACLELDIFNYEKFIDCIKGFMNNL